jgi:hypothetical protein
MLPRGLAGDVLGLLVWSFGECARTHARSISPRVLGGIISAPLDGSGAVAAAAHFIAGRSSPPTGRLTRCA